MERAERTFGFSPVPYMRAAVWRSFTLVKRAFERAGKRRSEVRFGHVFSLGTKTRSGRFARAGPSLRQLSPPASLSQYRRPPRLPQRQWPPRLPQRQ